MTDVKHSKTALLTGASGFIGSHLVRHLQSTGWRVEVIARPSAAEALNQMPGVAKVHVYMGATEEVMEAISACRPDVIFHLASLFLASHSPQQVSPLVEANVLFGAQLLEGMRFAGATALVNTGTSWQNARQDEYSPANLYAATKHAFEQIASYYVDVAGLRIVTLRLYDSYGPSDRRRKLLKLLVDCAATGNPLGMSPGEQVLDLVHVDDICRAFLQAAKLVLAQEGGGSNVYAVSGARYTVKQIAATLEELLGRKLPLQFGALPYREREIMSPWIGPELPGWKAEVLLKDGLSALLESGNLL